MLVKVPLRPRVNSAGLYGASRVFAVMPGYGA